MSQKAQMENRMRSRKNSQTKGDNKGRPPKIVSYCPVCPPEQANRPETTPKVMASSKAKIAKGKCGHRWYIGGASRPSNSPVVIAPEL